MNIEERKESIGWIPLEDDEETSTVIEIRTAIGTIENYIFDILEDKRISSSMAKRALKAIDVLGDNI